MDDMTPVPIEPIVQFEPLEALDIRVGTIGRVEEVPRSQKLMRLTVNFGDHSRPSSRASAKSAKIRKKS